MEAVQPVRTKTNAKNRGITIKYHVMSSHYSRICNTNHKYLCPLLSIGKMYALYRAICIESNSCCASADVYRKIFNNDFNLGFGSIRSDICARCDSGETTDQHKWDIQLAIEKWNGIKNRHHIQPMRCSLLLIRKRHCLCPRFQHQ